MRFTFAVVFAALMFASPAVAHERLDFRGQAIIPTGTTFAGTTVGGLSSITYDRRHDRYYIRGYPHEQQPSPAIKTPPHRASSPAFRSVSRGQVRRERAGLPGGN